MNYLQLNPRLMASPNELNGHDEYKESWPNKCTYYWVHKKDKSKCYSAINYPFTKKCTFLVFLHLISTLDKKKYDLTGDACIVTSAREIAINCGLSTEKSSLQSIRVALKELHYYKFLYLYNAQGPQDENALCTNDGSLILRVKKIAHGEHMAILYPELLYNKDRDKYCVPIPLEIIRTTDLTVAEKMVYFCICKQKGASKVTLESIAEQLDCTKMGVSKSMKNLIKKGYVVRVKDNRHSYANQYTVKYSISKNTVIIQF